MKVIGSKMNAIPFLTEEQEFQLNHSVADGIVDVLKRLPGTFSVSAPRCSRALVHNLQPASDRRLIFSHLGTGMIPGIAIISMSQGKLKVIQILP